MRFEGSSRRRHSFYNRQAFQISLGPPDIPCTYQRMLALEGPRPLPVDVYAIKAMRFHEGYQRREEY